MKIIKKGEIPTSELELLTERFEQEIECEVCKTIYKPDLKDFDLSTIIKAKQDGSITHNLVGKVRCPICNKLHSIEIKEIEEPVCSMMKKWGR